MYDIRQFKPVLYLLAALGLAGFALAAEQPALFVLAIGALVVNAALVRSGRFRPISRWMSNLLTLGMLAFVGNEWLRGSLPVLFIGQFIVALQLVKFYEQRANRDYAQILVLSFLLMVAAAINTASLLFGIMLITYVFIYLYACLLFHLKVETDAARAAQTMPVEKIPDATLRRDQRHLSRSMRRLTAAVALVAVGCAAVVFLVVPRASGPGILAQLQLATPQTLTGFSDNPQFQGVASIQGDDTPVARVKLFRNGQPVRGGLIMLRGVVFDVYGSADGPYQQWSRFRSDTEAHEVAAAHTVIGLTSKVPEGAVRWRQEILLEPINSGTLFALPGVFSFMADRDGKLLYGINDGTLRLEERPVNALRYTVESTGQLGAGRRGTPQLLPLRADIKAAIDSYARRSEVSGPLGAERSADGLLTQGDHGNDRQIVQSIERHLRSSFAYTLDLTDAREVLSRQDRNVAFLYTLKRGHCEYFAAAMTLLCQSLHIPARMVNGFATDEFNGLGDYYLVRRSHAHSWVEVYLDGLWVTFDPTSGNLAAAGGHTTLWQATRNLFDYLDYQWAASVIGYDNSQRDSIMETMEKRLLYGGINYGPVGRLRLAWKNAIHWMDTSPIFAELSRQARAAVMVLLIGLPLGALLWAMGRRWRIRLRAARIGVESLPQRDRARLVRQLGFYVELIRLLGRQGIVRPPQRTAREFCESLDFLPAEVFDDIQRLTRIFYRVRYGRADLRYSQQRRLSAIVARLGDVLGA